MIELDLEKYLSAYKGTNVDFYRFPGNYGDSLIWHGTKNILSSLGISAKYVDVVSPIHKSVLFIDGGGNFVDYYSDVRDFLLKKSDLYDKIVIFPHTIFGERQVEILNSVLSDVTVFCREETSLQFLRRKLTKGELFLWHDCALYNKLPQVPLGDGMLNVFRSDKESALKLLPDDNIDLSYDGYATKPLDELIKTLGEYEQVNTDRLHIAICAILIGKKVKLFPNSYYKNKAVFDYSLKKFPNIHFVEKFDS